MSEESESYLMSLPKEELVRRLRNYRTAAIERTEREVRMAVKEGFCLRCGNPCSCNGLDEADI